MKKYHFVVIFFLALGMSQCKLQRNPGEAEIKEAYDELNSSVRFNVLPAKYEGLPLHGEIPEALQPWAGDYWPTVVGGIAHRWQLAKQDLPVKLSPILGRYRTLTKQEIANASEDVLNTLSPALWSLLYAKYLYNRDRHQTAVPGSSVVMGTRCEEKITLDETGRVMQPSCRDVNPGAYIWSWRRFLAQRILTLADRSSLT